VFFSHYFFFNWCKTRVSKTLIGFIIIIIDLIGVKQGFFKYKLVQLQQYSGFLLLELDRLFLSIPRM